MSRARLTQLRRVVVENLACFGQLELRPGNLTLLLGANGAGKSTLLNLLFDLRAMVNGDNAANATFPTYKLDDGTSRLTVEAVVGVEPYEYQLELTDVITHDLSFGVLSPNWEIVRETLSAGNEPLTNFQDGLLTGADLAGPIPLNRDASPLSRVNFPEGSKVWPFKHWTDGIWLLRLEPQSMDASADEPEGGLDVSGKNFVSWLLSFSRRKQILTRVCAAASPSIQGLAELALERSGREWVLVARFDSGAKVDFDALSDGQRCLIVLYAVLHLVPRDGSLLLLDEPDAHVTPTEILPLFSAIRDRANTTSQVIVASHHPHVIDLLAPDTPWELLQEHGKVRAEPFRVDLSMGVPASKHLLLRGRS